MTEKNVYTERLTYLIKQSFCSSRRERNISSYCLLKLCLQAN